MTNPQELISRFLYDELDEAQQQEFNAWLAADPSNADLFMRETIVHRHFMERQLVDQEVLAENQVLTLACELPDDASTAEVARGTIFKIGIRMAGFAAAAVLLLTTSLPFLTSMTSSQNAQPALSIDLMLQNEWSRMTDRSNLQHRWLSGDLTHDQVVDIADYFALESQVDQPHKEAGLKDLAHLQVAFGSKLN